MSKRIRFALLLIYMLTLAFNIQFVTAQSSPVQNQNPMSTLWKSPDDSSPSSFNLLSTDMFNASHVEQMSESSGDTPLIYILVNDSIYDDVKFYIERYISDVENLGFNATVLSFSGGSHEDVKTILVNAYSEGLVGCLLVGDIPWACYEMHNPDPWGDEEFPIDFFYMDLDGVWTDTDSDGKYDQHTGDRTPEIWIGRIKASGMAKSEVSLIQNYFDKNHAYRTGVLSLSNRALIYIDDDHVFYSDEVDSAVSLIFDNRSLVKNKVTTQPADYLSRLTQNWSLVHLVVHGGPGWHQFKINDEWDGYVTSSDVRSADPHAFFYILVSCSNARYDKADYLGGWYLFSHTFGVAAVGTTKIGGMWFLSDFYSNFRQETLGCSFREWLANRVAGEDGNPKTWYDKKWYYGMTILGDPTLSLTTGDSTPTLTVHSSPVGVTFTVDGISHATPWSGTYAEGSSVGLVMPETHSVSEAKYYWSQWSDGVTSRFRTVTVDKDVTLEGIFELGNHDVAVTNVTASETVVGQGDLVVIGTTVENQGDFTETFSVTAYAGTTTIQTETVTLTPGSSTILTAIWNTSGFAEGDYTISAYASPVPGETDITDNTFIDGIITVSTFIHDVAVLTVEPSKTVVCEGYSMNIIVTVENQGVMTETFNVTAYVNATIIDTNEITLSSGNSITITFTWNTTGCQEYQSYTISAYAHPIPGETEITDNTFIDSIVLIVHVGDVNADGTVRTDDILAIAVAFGSQPGNPRWNPDADINCDGRIRVDDILIAAMNFGWP